MSISTKQRGKVVVVPWRGSQHPTPSAIIRLMREEELRPYEWDNIPNYRYAVRSHNYNKVLYILEGSLEIALPDDNTRVFLKTGDRINIPAGVRHSVIVGGKGVRCVEASVNRSRSS